MNSRLMTSIGCVSVVFLVDNTRSDENQSSEVAYMMMSHDRRGKHRSVINYICKRL